MQLLVISFFFYQLLMSTTLHNLTLMQYTDFIGMLDGAQSVSHSYSGTGLHQFLQGILNQALALGIEG